MPGPQFPGGPAGFERLAARTIQAARQAFHTKEQSLNAKFAQQRSEVLLNLRATHSGDCSGTTETMLAITTTNQHQS